MRTRMRTIAGLAGLTLAATVLGTVPADAAQCDCKFGNYCAWSNDNFGGVFRSWSGIDSWWGNNQMHDDAESIYNQGSEQYVNDHANVYMDADYANLDICLAPGESADFGMNDNDYDSHKWVDRC